MASPSPPSTLGGILTGVQSVVRIAIEPASDTGDGIDRPTDFADHLAAVSTLDHPPDTPAEYWSRFGARLATSEYTLTAEDLYTAEPTRHEVHVDDRVRYSPCVLDTLSAGTMESEAPVTVRSVDPVTNAPVRVTVRDDSIDVTPEDAVITFGVASSIPELESSDETSFGWMLGVGAEHCLTHTAILASASASITRPAYGQRGWYGVVPSRPVLATDGGGVSRPRTDSPRLASPPPKPRRPRPRG